MSRDWSATRQAEENIAERRVVARNDALIAELRKDIEEIENALDILNGVNPSAGDDLLTAIRSLGAYQAILKHKLYAATAD